MKRSRPVVEWSPHRTNEFVVAFATDIKLLESVTASQDQDTGAEGHLTDLELPRVDTGNKEVSRMRLRKNLIMVRSMKRVVRCIDWFPGTTDRKLIASGDISGAVQLVSFQDNKHLDSTGVVQTFAPSYGRQCNDVAWNPASPNLIMCGLDKLRNDNSILVWDVSMSMPELHSSTLSDSWISSTVESRRQSVPPATASIQQYSRYPQAAPPKKAYFETGMTEGTVAISWVPSQPHLIAAGSSFKWLRIYDIRSGGNRPAPRSIAAHNKSVRGICFDPNRPNCFATFSEDGQIKIWDERKTEEAIAAINCGPKNITQISWSPVRPGVLACITVEDKCISLWDIRKTCLEWEDSLESILHAENHPVGSQHGAHEEDVPGGISGGSNATNLLGGQTSSKIQTNVLDDSSKPAASAVGHAGNPESPTPQDGEETTSRATVILSKSDVRRYTSRFPASFCWIPSNPAIFSNNRLRNPLSLDQIPNEKNSFGQVANRVLYASWSGILDDVSLQDPLPLSISARSDLCFGLNKGLFHLPFVDLDPSTVISTRARLGYAMNARRNIDLVSQAIQLGGLALEGDKGKRSSELASLLVHGNPDQILQVSNMLDGNDIESDLANLIRIRDMWRWIHRASYLMDVQQSKGLADAGLISILSRRSTAQDEVHLDETLRPRFEVYRSRQRSFALALCGWLDFVDLTDSRGKVPQTGQPSGGQATSDKDQSREGSNSSNQPPSAAPSDAQAFLRSGQANATFSDGELSGSHSFEIGASVSRETKSVMGDNDGEYQRLAALAVFYCDLPSAVRILQEASERIRKQRRHTSSTKTSNPSSHQLLSTKPAAKRVYRAISSKLSSAQPVQHTFKARRNLGGYSSTPTRNNDDDATADLLQLVAMALAGYPESTSSSDGNMLWFSTCKKLLKRLKDFPVLRAALGFLMKNFIRRHVKGRHVSQNHPVQTQDENSKTHEKPTMAQSGLKLDLSEAGLRNSKDGSFPNASSSNSILPGSGKDIAGGNTAARKIGADSSMLPRQNSFLEEEFDLDSDTRMDGVVDYSCVLEEPAISLVDRIAFACRFLPDDQLFAFLLRCCESVTKEGRLDGILLTGLGAHGLRLVQAYVDETGDVQTAALASCHTIQQVLPAEDAKLLNRWVSSYRELLNLWQLWQERAKFDVAFASLQRERQRFRQSNPPEIEQTSLGIATAVSSPPNTKQTTTTARGELDDLLSWSAQEPHLYVVCTHCKESLLLSTLLGDTEVLGSIGRINRQKLTLPCCPRCKKRLSSCAVCVLPMNCINPYAQMAGLSQRDRDRISKLMNSDETKAYGGSNLEPVSASKRAFDTGELQPQSPLGLPDGTAQPFGRWFSWCLRCRHGGHAVCLMEWFSSHSHCPVSDCTCPCTSLG